MDMEASSSLMIGHLQVMQEKARIPLADEKPNTSTNLQFEVQSCCFIVLCPDLHVLCINPLPSRIHRLKTLSSHWSMLLWAHQTPPPHSRTP